MTCANESFCSTVKNASVLPDWVRLRRAAGLGLHLGGDALHNI
jgi:hypothetical protein